MPWPGIRCPAILRAVTTFSTKSSKPKRATSFEPDVARAFGAVIQATRKQQGYAQDAFALLAGVDRSYFGKLERGERQPTVGLLLRIAKALEIPGSELMLQAERLMAEARPKRKGTRT